MQNKNKKRFMSWKIWMLASFWFITVHNSFGCTNIQKEEYLVRGVHKSYSNNWMKIKIQLKQKWWVLALASTYLEQAWPQCFYWSRRKVKIRGNSDIFQFSISEHMQSEEPSKALLKLNETSVLYISSTDQPKGMRLCEQMQDNTLSWKHNEMNQKMGNTHSAHVFNIIVAEAKGEEK